MEFGVELEDTDVEWSKVLDKADIKVLADTLYNMWAAKQSKNKPLLLSDRMIVVDLDDDEDYDNDSEQRYWDNMATCAERFSY